MKAWDESRSCMTSSVMTATSIADSMAAVGSATSRAMLEVDAMKNHILRQPQIDENVVQDQKKAADMPSIRSRTIALRSRTIELISKAEDCDRQMCDSLSPWLVPTPLEKVSFLPLSCFPIATRFRPETR